MAIQVNINGVNKTVTQPKVNIGGTWRTVNRVQNNINGVWKTSFESFTVKVYRYGSLYQTLTVVKGDSVKLPSLGVGFATSSSSTTVSYNSGATITPTGNLNLYAVFQYSIKLYKYGTLYQTLTSKSQNSTASFTLPTCTADTGDTFYGWTKTSGSTTRNYTSGQTVSTSGMSLYAIFEYTAEVEKTGYISSQYTGTMTSSQGSVNSYPHTVSATAKADGTCTISGYISSDSSNGSNISNLTLDTFTNYVKIGSTYVSGTLSRGKTISVNVTKGQTINIKTTGTAGYSGSIAYASKPYISVSYPTTVEETAYRSTK